MEIIHTTTISPAQAGQMQRLAGLCIQAEGLSLSCPDDGDEFWFLHKRDGSMGAFLAVYKLEDQIWECSAFTRPDCRKRGYFSLLLERVCSDSRDCGEPDLCFVTDGRCPAALHLLKALEMAFYHHEYMMRCDLGKQAARLEGRSGNMLLRMNQECPADGVTKLEVTGWLPGTQPGRPQGEPVVTCSLYAKDRGVYLYGLYTSPGYRRRGLAFCFLCQLVQLLHSSRHDTLGLQVSSLNTEAMGLYKKAGFRITETLSYYLY